MVRLLRQFTIIAINSVEPDSDPYPYYCRIHHPRQTAAELAAAGSGTDYWPEDFQQMDCQMSRIGSVGTHLQTGFAVAVS